MLGCVGAAGQVHAALVRVLRAWDGALKVFNIG